MTQHNKADKKKDVINKDPLKKQKIISSATSPLLIITAITSISAIAMSLYSVNQNLTLSRDITNKNIKSRATTVKILSDFEENILNKQHILKEQIDIHFKLQQKSISIVNKEVLELSKSKRGDEQTWKLQKAAYLISMAQLNLHWDKTTKPTISLLRSAALLVKSLNNPQFIGVRQSLNNEITSLQAINHIDTIGILTKLQSLSMAVTTLPLKKSFNQQDKNDKNKTIDQSKSKWQQTLDISLAKLSKIIVIRKHHIDFKPLISKQDQQLIINQFKLNLKQIQWALIHKDKQLYKFNLEQLKQSLNEYFDTDKAATKAVLTSIMELNKQNISPNLPNINQSYKQLIELIKLQNNGEQKQS